MRLPRASNPRRELLTLWPRTFWTVVERNGQPELVIWRQWLGNAYSIVSLAGKWGRWDRQRIDREASLSQLSSSDSTGREAGQRTHTLRIDVPLNLDDPPHDYDVVADAVTTSLAISRAAFAGHICDDVIVEMLDASSLAASSVAPGQKPGVNP